MLSVLLLAQIVAASPPPTRFELPNGLRVWVQEDHSRPVALVHITYHAGSQNEGPGITGIAHYVEHMVYRATENIRNEDVYGYIDRIGGRYTGGTWPDVTRYAETVPSWAVESALRVTAERMTRALFDSLEFERERGNVVTEAHGFADDDPASALSDAVMMAAFELHPYRYSSNTWARDNLKLTRAQAYAWYREHYGPNNAVLVVVGDVRTDDIRRLVEKHFGPLAPATGNGRIDVVEPDQRFEKRVLLTGYPSDSARLEVVYKAPPGRSRLFPYLIGFDAAFVTSLRATLATKHPGVRVETEDSARAYPFVYRIRATGERSVDMTAVLATMDEVLESFRANNSPVPALMPAVPRDSAVAAPSAVPPRRSNLPQVAEALAARDAPAWELPRGFRDSLIGRGLERPMPLARALELLNLQRHQRTVGILQPGISWYAPAPGDIPATTTPPARRMRPEPVPDKALEPLAAISIDRGGRQLANGVRVRAARVAGDQMLVRVLIDFARATDTIVRTFPVSAADSGLRVILNESAGMLARGPSVRMDSSTEALTRARVMAAVLPAPGTGADVRAPIRIAVVGPQAPEKLIDLAARYFGVLPTRRQFQARERLATADTAQEFVAVLGRQYEVVAGLPGVPRNHRDRRALELLNYIVGVPYYGGRLGWALTKAGLTYSSAAQTYFGEAGHILLSTTADFRNVPATVQAIREIVAGVGERGVEAWELREAQAFVLGRTILYGAREDSPASVIAAALTESDAAGIDLLDLPTLSRAYLGITLDDVNRVARNYYRPERLKVVVGGFDMRVKVNSPFAPGTFRALFEP